MKVDIQDAKVDIESVLSAKGSDFTVKTTVHIHRLFEKFGFDGVFGRSAVMELLELKSSGASKFLSNLVQAIYRRRKYDVEPVFGHMKRDFGVRRTHLRGQRAVENDVGLTLMALNLTKLGKMINQLRPFLVNNQKCELQFLIKSKIIVRIFLVRS